MVSDRGFWFAFSWRLVLLRSFPHACWSSVSSLEKCLCRSFAEFYSDCLGFSYWSLWDFYVIQIMLLLCCLVAMMCLALCDLKDCSLPGSSAHGFSQARILEWVAISFSNGSFNPGNKPASPHGRHILYHWVTREVIIHILTPLDKLFASSFYHSVDCLLVCW